MATRQSKIGHREMIEGCAAPIVESVATGTISTILPVVNIVRLVTGNTGFSDIGKVCRNMTAVTAYRSVSARQWQGRSGMIKTNVTPVLLVVTTGTVFSTPTIVNIVIQMTRHALRRCLAVQHLGLVAVLASSPQVTAT